MKKNLLFILIGLIAGTTLTATAAYVYTARDIGYSPSDENWSVTNAGEALTSLKDDLNTISNKVEGIERIHKADETELVALVSDDSFYTDSNGKYVLSNSNTGRTLLADTSTYKSLPATQDCVSMFESDTVSPLNVSNSNTYIKVTSTYTVPKDINHATLVWSVEGVFSNYYKNYLKYNGQSMNLYSKFTDKQLSSIVSGSGYGSTVVYDVDLYKDDVLFTNDSRTNFYLIYSE